VLTQRAGIPFRYWRTLTAASAGTRLACPMGIAANKQRTLLAANANGLAIVIALPAFGTVPQNRRPCR